MKGQLKIKSEIQDLSLPLAAKSVAVHVALAAVALLSSRVRLLSVLTPLGVLLAAAVPSAYSLTCGIGAFLGYLFFPVGDTPFRYIAALFAVVSIRLLLTGLKKFSDSAPFCGVITVVAVTMCNTVTVIGDGDNALILLCEGVLTGGLTYFTSRTFSIDFRKRVGLTGEELACSVITIDLLLLSLLPIAVGGFSIGRVLVAALILAAARFGSASGGAVSGAAVGFAVALGSSDARLVCLYSVSGLISGLFSSGGRIMTVLGFVVPAFISLGIFGIGTALVGFIVEIIIGIAIFLMLPKSFCVFLAAFFSPPTRLESLEGMRKSLVMRLRLASGALGDVSGTIEEVSDKLSRINIPEPSEIFKLCEADACRGCSFRVSCWETELPDTLRALGALSSRIRNGGGTLNECAPAFAKKCLRVERLEESLVRNYTDYLARLSAEERISAIRGAVSDQFDGISDMLLDLSIEFDRSRRYDLDTAQNIVTALREIDLLTTDCSCSVDKFGRMTVEAKLHNVEGTRLNRKKILEQLEASCERRFVPPTLRQVEDIVYLTVSEKPQFTPDVGVCQLPESRSGICGDSYTYFGDGTGRFFLLLSDGMGTGGRAAVDGAMTTGLLERLIKAGFGFDCSLKIVNSALLYKSSEESLSTADIACIDLHTGETSLYKAGAAPTFVRRAGRVGKAESHSLPIGILREVGFDRSSITLKKDDIVVIMSDGAVTSGTDWICKEIEQYDDGGAQELSERIAEGALRRCDKAHIDDITVMVAILNG